MLPSKSQEKPKARKKNSCLNVASSNTFDPLQNDPTFTRCSFNVSHGFQFGDKNDLPIKSDIIIEETNRSNEDKKGSSSSYSKYSNNDFISKDKNDESKGDSVSEADSSGKDKKSKSNSSQSYSSASSLKPTDKYPRIDCASIESNIKALDVIEMQHKLINERPRYMNGTTSRILKYTSIDDQDIVAFKRKTDTDYTRCHKLYSSPLAKMDPSSLTVKASAHKHPDLLGYMHMKDNIVNKQHNYAQTQRTKLSVPHVLFDYEQYVNKISKGLN